MPFLLVWQSQNHTRKHVFLKGLRPLGLQFCKTALWLDWHGGIRKKQKEITGETIETGQRVYKTQRGRVFTPWSWAVGRLLCRTLEGCLGWEQDQLLSNTKPSPEVPLGYSPALGISSSIQNRYLGSDLPPTSCTSVLSGLSFTLLKVHSLYHHSFFKLRYKSDGVECVFFFQFVRA